MDAFYLDPRHCNTEHIGTKHECMACGQVKLYEEGKTYLVTIDRQDGPHLVFAWFCSLACLTSLMKGGTA